MSLQNRKLGRNPLEKLADPAGKATLGMHALGMKTAENSAAAGAPVERKFGSPTALEKLREMRIEVDWRELYATTVGKKLRGLSRFLQNL